MFFNPKKSAFRAGRALGTSWDANNIGDFSVAMGYQTKATSGSSVALGQSTTASGHASTAFGDGTTASGALSTAFGQSSTASGPGATAFGRSTTASGTFSTAFGWSSTASGERSIAMGDVAEASGGDAIAIGDSAKAMGNRSGAFGYQVFATGDKSMAFGDGSNAVGQNSTAFGQGTAALGAYSTAIGSKTTANAAYEIVLGRYNDTYIPNSTTNWNSSDRLLVVGNGMDWASRSNALTILKNGNTGIGESNPTQLLHLSGESGVDGIKFPDGTEQTTAYTGGAVTLDAAYDEGGAGAGRTIDASDGAVFIDGSDGLIVTGSTGIGTSIPTAQLHVADGNVIFDRNQDGTAVSRSLTLSGKRSGNANYFAALEFRNQDDNIEYLGSAIRSYNSGGFEDADLRLYVRNGLDGFLSEGLRITNDADIYVPKAAGAIIMKSQNGTCWQLTVSDAGVLQVAQLFVCPQ